MLLCVLPLKPCILNFGSFNIRTRHKVSDALHIMNALTAYI